MKLENSETLQNLVNAFAGESQARNRYTMYAKIAKKEGYEALGIMSLHVKPSSQAFKKLCADLKSEGLYLIVWTVNNAEEAKAYSEIVDAITTDDIRKIKEALK